MAADIYSGFMAGMQTGGRFSGVGTGLKEVLKGLQQEGRMGAYENIERTRQQGQTTRKMLGAGYAPTEQGWEQPEQELPEGMSEAGYELYQGKPYKTRSIVSDVPGEREAWELIYLENIMKGVQRTDPLLASEIKVKLTERRRSLAQGLLGLEESSDTAAQPGMGQRAKQWGLNMLRAIGGGD